jgi:hypothetical protein
VLFYHNFLKHAKSSSELILFPCTCRDLRRVNVSQNKIVIRYADGRTRKGVTNNFSADREIFHLIPLGASLETMPLEIHVTDLKAVFFVKEFDSKPKSRENKDPAMDKNIIGREVKVTFKDGEVLTGKTTSYNVNRPGFFMVPADSTSNNERCFVVRKATKSVLIS